MRVFLMKKSAVAVVYLLLFVLVIGGAGFAAASNHTTGNATNVTGATGSGAKGTNTSVAPLVPAKTGGTTVAIEGESAKVEQAYACLQGQVANKSTFSLEEAAFGVLALGSQDKLMKTIQSAKSEREACWPKTGCTIRDTALVALTYQRTGIQTSEIEQWLQSKRIAPRELTWYLEMDTAQKTSANCTIKYDGRLYSLAILDDMKFSDDAGTCLQRLPSGYWLTIAPSCIGRTFEVSCDQDFVSALIYQKSGEGMVYVSSETHAAASLGTTRESVNVSCFSTGGGCDYQGTLWASYLFHKVGKGTAATLPYLVALADDTTKYFPSAFLYMLTKDPDREYYGQILQQRKQNQFWEFAGNGYTRFYDTSLGVLALGAGGAGSADVSKTHAYLLSVQTKEGCWNNNHFRDSAFAVYAAWPRAKLPGVQNKASFPLCREGGFSCERLSECLEAGGIQQQSYECSGGSICCSAKVERPSCASQQGTVCKATEQCEGSVSASSDGQCCIGSCKAVSEQNACESAGGTCASSCGSGEEEVSESCGTANVVCCTIKDEGRSLWPWIAVLGILIILVIIAIVKRDAIRFWWFRKQGKASATPMMRPGMPPSGGGSMLRPMARPSGLPPAGLTRPGMRPPMRPSSGTRDHEMEETMRKLKEMSG